jgi:hypothetical protein
VPWRASPFDQTDLAEMAHPDFPGERLLACFNPLLAEERARKRPDLLSGPEKQLEKLPARSSVPGVRSAAIKISDSAPASCSIATKWAKGRKRAPGRLGLRGRRLKVAFSSRGDWGIAHTGSLRSALSKATLRRHGFLMPLDLAAQ